jgi:hypothetical protein
MMGFWFSAAELLLVVAATLGTSLAGVVRDGSNGEPIASAVVSLTDLDRAVVTDSEGRYEFREVPPGQRRLVVRRMGYETRTLYALVPSQGRLEIDIALRQEPVTLPEVEVRTAIGIPGLDGDDSVSYLDRSISLEAVRADPLLAEPDVLQALAGGDVTLRPESPSGLQIRGGASDQVAYLLDGIPVYSPYHAAGTMSAWNPDAIARVELSTSSRESQPTDALSGAVSATTLPIGARLRTRGSISTTQARATIDGPLGRPGAGYLLSLRSSFPGFIAPKRESSYLRGDSRDWIARIELPLAGGHARVLGYGSDNALDAASTADAIGNASGGKETGHELGPERNSLGWRSRSAGVGWSRQIRRAVLDIRAWTAAGEATAAWHGADSTLEELVSERLSSTHSSDGLIATLAFGGRERATRVGIRAQNDHSFYRVAPLPNGADNVSLRSRTPVWAVFAEHTRRVLANAEATLATEGAMAAGEVYFAPSVELRWKPSNTTTVTAAYVRSHQFAQSLRNSESVISTIFPADLYVGAGGSNVPVATSNMGTLALDLRPRTWLRVRMDGWTRGFAGLALVAPRAADPFATGDFEVGSGTARGVAVEAESRGNRYAAVASYGVQYVRLRYGDTTYVPDHGATHTIYSGVIFFPSATSSVRLSVTGVFGRRGTTARGHLEWESCNLIDQGCELAGSAEGRAGPLGATRLPGYVRVDIGLRKSWQFAFGGRKGEVAAFGTVSNILGRRNVLSIVADPTTGELAALGMRPRAPLVVGIDWRY